MNRTIDRPVKRRREKVFHRQDPMSCRFCRSKKLKCDRLTPCSNCTSRRIPCVSAIEATVWSQQQQEAGGPSPTARGTDSRHDDLAQRVKKLEEILFSKTNQDLAVANLAQDGAGENCSSQVQSHDQFASELSEGATGHGMSSKSAGNLEASNKTQAATKSMARNTDEYLLLGTSLSLYKPLTASEMAELLPSVAVARTLFSFYVDNLNWTQHIIHVPTTRRELDVLYNKLRNSVRPECSQISLLAAILTVAAYFWPDTSTGKATCPVEDPKAHCRKWIVLVQRALMEANHLTCPTLETLQAKLLLTQFLPTYPQSTGRTGHLALLINQAHILQLHRMDSPRRCKARIKTAEDAIKVEIQRRIWWTIVITDWMFSFINWGQLGTYLIHPDHMNVQYPSNVDDKDIVSDGSYDQPFLGPPTEMTFLIAKIRITKIVREFTDVANQAEVGVDELDYGFIMTFDKKITDVYDSLPSYLRYDDTDRPYLHTLFKERPYLERQRALLLFGLHNSLALLHRQFLARSYRDPRYTYSRIVCLRSTRIVIEMQEVVRQSFLGRTWLVIYHLFVAATTLTMDYVYNRDNPQVAAERKREILKCYRILEECGEQDPEVKQGLESLKRIMQDRRDRSEPRQPSIPERPSPEELPSTEADTWSFPDSDVPVLPAQFQQLPFQAPAEAADGAHRASRDPTVSWAPQHMAQATSTNNAVSDRLTWPSNMQSSWINPGNLPSASQQISAMHDSSETGPAGADFATAEGPWIEPSPDLWLPCLNANGDAVPEFQWEKLFRDLDTQQFMTGF